MLKTIFFPLLRNNVLRWCDGFRILAMESTKTKAVLQGTLFIRLYEAGRPTINTECHILVVVQVKRHGIRKHDSFAYLVSLLLANLSIQLLQRSFTNIETKFFGIQCRLKASVYPRISLPLSAYG